MPATVHRVQLLLTAAATAALPACRSTDIDRHREAIAERPTERLEPAAFAGPLAEPGSPSPERSSPSAATPSAAGTVTAPGAGPGPEPGPDLPPGTRLVVTPDAGRADPTADPAEPPVLVEAKVGDVNGLPIYASAFLEPLSGRFEAEARRMDRREWLQMAAEAIDTELNQLVTDELLRAEAAERLTPEQELGLAAFLQVVRQNLLSQSYGSRELAERRLQERQGLTTEQYLEQQRQAALIQVTIEEEILKRVSVSSRDIQQRYERDIDRYQRPPLARYRLVSVRADDTEAVQAVEGRLAAGESLAEVAASPVNRFSPDTDGVREVEVVGPRGEAQLLGPALNEAAQNVAIGETVGPIEAGSSLFWLSLEDIRDRSISLYDAQLQIEQEIRSERTFEELERFQQRMLDRANMTTLSEIRGRLLRIAAERFAPEE